jgi:hypothetical protein
MEGEGGREGEREEGRGERSDGGKEKRDRVREGGGRRGRVGRSKNECVRLFADRHRTYMMLKAVYESEGEREGGGKEEKVWLHAVCTHNAQTSARGFRVYG